MGSQAIVLMAIEWKNWAFCSCRSGIKVPIENSAALSLDSAYSVKFIKINDIVCKN